MKIETDLLSMLGHGGVRELLVFNEISANVALVETHEVSFFTDRINNGYGDRLIGKWKVKLKKITTL